MAAAGRWSRGPRSRLWRRPPFTPTRTQTVRRDRRRPVSRKHRPREARRSPEPAIPAAGHADAVRSQRLRLRLQPVHELRLLRRPGGGHDGALQRRHVAEERRHLRPRLSERAALGRTPHAGRNVRTRRRCLPADALDRYLSLLQADRDRGAPWAAAARVRRARCEAVDRRLPVHVRVVRPADRGGVWRLRPRAVRCDQLATTAPGRPEDRRRGTTQRYRRDRFLRMRLTVSGVMPRYDASIDWGTRRAI